MAKKNKTPTDAEVEVAQPTASKPSGGNANKYRYIYARKSVERRIRRRRIALVFLIFVLVASLIAGATYAVLSFVDYNSFRVNITQGHAKLTLSNDEAFSNPTTQLSTGAARKMLDTTYTMLPEMKFRNMDGSYDGDNDFFGSSFYLRNSTDEAVKYNLRILITDVFNNLDECLRVLVIREPLQLNEDGEWELVSRSLVITKDMTLEQKAQAQKEAYRYCEYICYGKERSSVSDEEKLAAQEAGEELDLRERVAYNIDRNGEFMETVSDPNYNAEEGTVWYCTSFKDASLGTVVDKEYKTLLPYQKVRYTIAIWLEGSDPDTTNDKLGGSLTMNVSFSTVDGGLDVEE